MSKIHVIKLKYPVQFGQVNVGTEQPIALVTISHPDISLGSVLSALQYNHAEVAEVLDYDEEDQDPEVPEEAAPQPSQEESESGENDPNLEGNSGSEGQTDQGGQLPQVTSDLAAAGFDEGLIEALAANEIMNLEQLRNVVASGKELIDLDKIGVVRAKKILELLQPK